jgi:hypothetical protein
VCDAVVVIPQAIHATPELIRGNPDFWRFTIVGLCGRRLRCNTAHICEFRDGVISGGTTQPSSRNKEAAEDWS